MIRKIVINILLLFSFYTTGAEQTHHDFDARLKKAFDIDDLELKEFQTGKTTEQGPRLERAEIARKVGEQRDQKAFENLSEETDFINDLKINSANLVDIILDVEDEYGIEIDNESMEKMLSVKSAIDIIEIKLQQP